MREFLGATILASLVGGLIYLAVGTTANLDHVKARAEARWQEVGYQVVGYEGYQRGVTLLPEYGGARVWYSLRRAETNIIYTGYLTRWGNEIHVYGPRAVDAIAPR